MKPGDESKDHGPCCAASRTGSPQDGGLSALEPRASGVVSNSTRASSEMVRLEGGEFLMGTDDPIGFPADGEGPVRHAQAILDRRLRALQRTLRSVRRSHGPRYRRRALRLIVRFRRATSRRLRANAGSGAGSLVAPGLRCELASSGGTALLHRGSYGSPRGARLVERRGL